jgi:hypothetical protein
VANDGEHLGGELGQSGARVRVGRGHSRIGGRAISRNRSAWRSRCQAVHRLAGIGVPELRTVAGRRAAAAAIHVSHHAGRRRPERAIRGTLSGAADPQAGIEDGRCAARARADARTGAALVHC